MTRNYDAAKELLSETLYQAFKGFHDLKSHEAFLSYVFTIASRVFYKSVRNKDDFVEDFDFDRLTNNEIEPDVMLDITFLRQSMNELSDDYKETLVLFEIEGFSRKEISHILGVSEETIKSRLFRARKKLAELMGVGDESRVE